MEADYFGVENQSQAKANKKGQQWEGYVAFVAHLRRLLVRERFEISRYYRIMGECQKGVKKMAVRIKILYRSGPRGDGEFAVHPRAGRNEKAAKMYNVTFENVYSAETGSFTRLFLEMRG